METKPYYENKEVGITIYNGDCLEVMKQFKDRSFDLVLTDPPYGVLPKGKINDKFDWDNKDIIKFTPLWLSIVGKKVKKVSFIFSFWSQKFINDGILLFNPDRIIFWRYDNLINIGNGDFAYDYEPIFVIRNGGKKLNKGKHSCDLHYTKPQSNFKKDKLYHPTQKPIGLIQKIIEISTNQSDLILDPFMGSGTTLVAAKKLGRKAVGIEISEEYCDIAVRRIKEASRQLKLFKERRVR